MLFTIYVVKLNEEDLLVNDALEDEVRPGSSQRRRAADVRCISDAQTERFAEIRMARPLVAPSLGIGSVFLFRWIPVGGADIQRSAFNHFDRPSLKCHVTRNLSTR